MLRNLVGGIDLVGVDVFAQADFEFGEELVTDLLVSFGLQRKRVDVLPVELALEQSGDEARMLPYSLSCCFGDF